MPAKGKHRRPKSRSVARGFAVAGTGGAALALPLLGAAGAQAAGAPAVAPAAAPVQAPQVPAALQAAPAAAAQSAPAVYTVVPGDYLSKIAQDRHLSGGWQQLYADNREAVGTNPSLIHPGLKLTLGAQGEAAPAAQAPAEKSAPAPAKKSSASPSQDKGSADVAPAPAAPTAAAAAAAAPAKKSTAAKSAAGTVSAAGFVAPVGGGISTQYKTPGAMWSSGYHTGVDFIASSGTTVRAVGAGTVVSAGWAGAYGNEVVIRHADGKYSQYGHLSQLSVSAGQSVTGGQTLGLSGSTGNSTGPHLHFEIRTGPSYGSDIDPLAYLRTKGVSI
ncbi:LysM peptidoglycan-binding domain-containing M23 family metallopeptidase [Streptomyces sp. NBC_01443]|uniref:LysM peptidoglycan-binding domain-containing M23 family metallopeptidase n=1 Tax=Streptomyces sp. NBC_01443 TaxID=2903868 RepID=UPI002256EDE1|nr:LysM peptidoglycan-binding domain-containing M23 family metallopeptidase [Streptomyces sp. NBC_01443]MCX4626503.1 LysM peptidoglycan-binding domain-containing M23 family metallopeptidase [Streptomyces sp. NBC_01443]